jgi:hypothetical protein
LRVVDAAQPDRVVRARRRRRRSAEGGRDLARADGLERCFGAVCEGKRGGVALDDPEAAHHLGRRHELWEQPAKA